MLRLCESWVYEIDILLYIKKITYFFFIKYYIPRSRRRRFGRGSPESAARRRRRPGGDEYRLRVVQITVVHETRNIVVIQRRDSRVEYRIEEGRSRQGRREDRLLEILAVYQAAVTA